MPLCLLELAPKFDLVVVLLAARRLHLNADVLAIDYADDVGRA
jgi:hypothetical protein